MGFPRGSDSEESACNVGDLGSIPGLGRFPWRWAWQPTPVFLPGESTWPPKGFHINTKAKPYSKASKLRDGCAMPILQLNRSTTLHISRQAAQSHSKPTDTPKHTTGQGTALQRDKIQLHPWEHKHKSPHPENLHNALIRPHKLEYSLHN